MSDPTDYLDSEAEPRILLARLPVAAGVEFLTIDNVGHALHDALGGYMETFPLPAALARRGLIGIADEDGNLRELPYNPHSVLLGRPLVGPILIVRSDPPEFVSLTPEDQQAITDWLGEVVFITVQP